MLQEKPRKTLDARKAPRDFLPRKEGTLHPGSGCLGAPLSLPQSLYVGWGWGERTLKSVPKFFQMDRLSDLFTHGRPVTRGVHGVRSHPPSPQAQKVSILLLNIQVKECSRLN